MRSLLGRLLILMFFFSSARLVFAGDWKGRIVTIDGTPHVQNPGAPAENEIVLEPERLWAIGGDSDAVEELFGAITKILVDENGNTYLLDSQIMQVVVFSPEGDFLRTLGRSGEGPGEFRSPITMCLLPGGALGVVQMMPSRIVVFDLAGEPQPDFQVPGGGGFASIQKMQSAGETVVIAMQNTSLDNKKMTVQGQLLRLDVNGNIEATLWNRSQERNLGKIVVGSQSKAVLPLWVAGTQGNVFLSPNYNEYRIDVIGIDGRTVRVIVREYESRKRTEEEMDQLRKQFESLPAQLGNIEVKVDATDRDIQHLLARDNGELWVMSSHGRSGVEDGELGPFEVFDDEGRYFRDVRFLVDYKEVEDEWHIVRDRLYIIKKGRSSIKSAFAGVFGISEEGSDAEGDDDLELPEVVCYKLGYSTD